MDTAIPVPAGGGRPLLSIYGRATRAFSFPASIVPVIVGTVLAARGYGGSAGAGWNPGLFVLILLGALMAHAGGNVLNDYYDFRAGVDTRPDDGSGVLTQGLLSPGEMFRFGYALLAGAGLIGGILLAVAPGARAAIVPLAVIGLGCAVLYTLALKRLALGDLVIMTAFGGGLTFGAYAVQHPAGSYGAAGLILLLSIPLTLLVDAILHANNMRDAETDKATGTRTIATLLGAPGSLVLHTVLIFGPPVVTVVFVFLRLIPVSALAVLLSAPLLIKAFRSGDVPFTAQSDLVFGLLYAIGIGVMPRP